MILNVDGSRGSGKTYLLDRFFAQNTNPKIVRYRFDFPGWVGKLGLGRDDTQASLHYLSLGNVLTVMEMMKNDNSKLLVLDRGIFSCFVWSQLRKRISWNTAVTEIKAIMASPVYSNYQTLYVDPIKPEGRDERNKDMWDNVHTRSEEELMYREFFDETIVEHHSFDKNCQLKEIQNHFEETTVSNFIGHVNDIAFNELD